MLMGFEQPSAGPAEAQTATPENVLVCRVSQKTRVDKPFRRWCRRCVHAKGQESPHNESSPGGVSKFATDIMAMGENGTPISIQAVFDGLTEAFANVAPYKSTSRGFAERALAMNMLSTGYQKVPVSARSRLRISLCIGEKLGVPVGSDCYPRSPSKDASDARRRAVVAVEDRTWGRCGGGGFFSVLKPGTYVALSYVDDPGVWHEALVTWPSPKVLPTCQWSRWSDRRTRD